MIWVTRRFPEGDVTARPTAIEALAAQSAAAALVLDFDGVLAPIVEDPETSSMPEQVATSLAELVPALGTVAVLSGRPASFLASRVRVPGVRLLGSYGMEEITDGNGQLSPAAARWLAAVGHARDELTGLLAMLPGVRIETKPASVAVHWRQAPDRAVAATQVATATARVAAATGLRLEPGKLVSELRPPIDIDKGSALTALIREVRPVVTVYAGDDLGDLPALRVVREAGGYGLAVDHGAETDPRLLAAADEVVAGTGGLAAWLADLARAVAASGSR
jgi:trehalose 6-phosphate phosphatase